MSNLRTSVLIIAHNEENHISKCIESVLDQTQKADEIIVLVHNSTDQTSLKANQYPVTVISYNGPTGIVAARVEGLSHVSGDIILCTDGDSFVAQNWVQQMVHTLTRNNNVLVGSWIKFKGTIFGFLGNIPNKYFCLSKKNPAQWIWGPSMAFWGRDKNNIKEFLLKSTILSEQLALSRNPDDYWLALFMSQEGNLEVTNKTWVTQHSKESSTTKAISRTRENVSNGNRMKKYFEENFQGS